MTRGPSIPESWASGSRRCGRASTSSGGVFDLAALRARLESLEVETARPDLWDDRENAERVNREKNAVEREVALYDALDENLEETETLLELAREEADADSLREVAEQCTQISLALEDVELRQLLGGEYDDKAAIVSINSGAGGTDAADWAEMLLRMYSALG